MGSELDGLQVFGETAVGWCASTPVNESADVEGKPVLSTSSFNASDPHAPMRRVHDDPQVCALREHLRAHNGIRNLEIVAPHEIERAARIFFRDGFVVVRDLLDAAQLARFRDGSARVLKDILAIPGEGSRKYVTETGRLPHRYSYGTASASRQLLHDPVWASMLALPTTTPILERIFGSQDYAVLGAGGDLCLPGAIEYQALHADVHERFDLPPERLAQARTMGLARTCVDGSTEPDARSRQLIVERTPPLVTINFLMSDLTHENGPIRQIPATQGRADPPPAQSDEPEWMRLSTLVGAKAGAGVIRDNRAWHGATPNVSREIRAKPNVEYGAPWLLPSSYRRTLPHALWLTLSPQAQHLARHVKTDPGVWPEGAGVMHPLAAERQKAKAQAPE